MQCKIKICKMCICKTVPHSNLQETNLFNNLIPSGYFYRMWSRAFQVHVSESLLFRFLYDDNTVSKCLINIANSVSSHEPESICRLYCVAISDNTFAIACSAFSNEITASLTYEELLPFIIDPGWIHLRKICFTTCLIGFFVIFLAACISTHISMLKMCNAHTSIPMRADNDSMQIDNVMQSSKGILSVILDGFNTTVPN